MKIKTNRAIMELGMNAGKFMGEFASNLLSNSITNTLGSIGNIGSALSTGVGGATNSMTLAFTNTIGSAMSNTTINGGSFRDILTSGRDSIRDTDTLKSIGISGLTAGLTQGLTQYLDTSLTNNIISKGNIALNPNATLTQRLTSALYESAITTTTNTTMQSLFNKEHSFKDILKRQAVNTGVGALANIGAQEIGKQYHSGNLKMGMNGTMGNLIGKTTQLTLHAGLGALSNKLTGNDALSGAVSGVSGEIFAELLGNSLYKTTSGNLLTEDQRNTLIQYGGLAGGLSALINGKLTNQSNNEIANNMFAGQRLGSNAVENNLTSVVMNKDRTKGVVVDAKKDGNTDIVDQDGKVVGKTMFDDTFIMYGSDNLENGVAKDNIIHFDKNITDYVNGLVEQAKGEILPVWAIKSSNRGEYDIKYSLGDNTTKTHYDGYVYNGEIVTGRGSGNILFGRNKENAIIFNFVIDLGAGFYHFQALNNNQKNNFINSKPLSWYGETDEAVKHYNKGSEEQKELNQIQKIFKIDSDSYGIIKNLN